MTQESPKDRSAAADPTRKRGDTRASRTIRFSDREWQQVTEAAARHDINSPAEFVRNAALTMAEDESSLTPGTLSPGTVRLIEHTFRGVLFLSTLKREEMIGEGRQDEIENLIQQGREAQSELLSAE